jgi:phage tail sheath gpL-like
MGLQSNLPSDVRQPGTAHTHDTTSASRGATPTDRRLAIVAPMGTGGTATADVPVQVFSESEARLLFDVGTPATLMVEMAIAASRATRRQHGGGQPAIWVSPLADPGGTAAVHRFAVGGAATESKDLIVRVSGRPIRAAIASGDDNEAAATKLKAALDAAAQTLPVTAAIATLVNVDLTARVADVNGSDIDLRFVSGPAGLTVTVSEQSAGAGRADPTAALDALLGQPGRFMAIAIAGHESDDLDDAIAYWDEAADAQVKKFGQAFFGERGSVGTSTTLTAAANHSRISLWAVPDTPSLSYELAAALAAMTATVERPSYNYTNTELPIYAPDPGDGLIGSQIETLLAAGATPGHVTEQGRVAVTRWVTTKTSENSATFEALLDGGNQKTLDHYSLLADAEATLALKGASADADFLALVEDIVQAILFGGEAAGDLHNVAEHLDELRVEAHQSLPSRILVEVPQSVVQPALQIDFTHRLFVEVPAAQAA